MTEIWVILEIRTVSRDIIPWWVIWRYHHPLSQWQHSFRFGTCAAIDSEDYDLYGPSWADDPDYWHLFPLPFRFGWRRKVSEYRFPHYNDVIMCVMASQITSLTIVYSTVYSGADHRKHQSSASLAFVRGIHRWPVNSPHKGPVTLKMFLFDDVIMICSTHYVSKRW